MNRYLKETKLLDYSTSSIQRLIKEQGWHNQPTKDKIENIYNFIRDDIKFGYNIDDKIPSSMILKDGYGQCNTKGTLFMSLLRGVGIPCRFHGFVIDKKLQKGAFSGIWYLLAPKEIIHSWVEVFYNGKWLNLEGFIVDVKYLSAVKRKNSDCKGSFCGYGVATNNFSNPEIYWNENNTYIQKEGIIKDLGTYDDPDTFFGKYSQNTGPIKKFVYLNIMRHAINSKVKSIRHS